MATDVKARVDVGAMVKALKMVRGAVPSRTTIPILANLLIQASGERLSLTTTNLDQEVSTSFGGCGCTEAFATTVPAQLLADIFANLDEGAQAELVLADGRLIVKSGRSRLRLPTLPEKDFPRIATDGWTTTFEMDAAEIGRLIAGSGFAMSREETRYYLNGVFLHRADDRLAWVALDGYRLARHLTALPAGAEAMPDIIVSRQSIDLLRGLITDGSGGVTIAASPTKVRFEIGDISMIAKLIDATYPDYQRTIPQENPHLLVVDRVAIDRALTRMMLLTQGKERIVTLDVKPSTLTVSTRSAECGDGEEQVPCTLTGGDLRMGFNGRFLRETLAVLTGPTAELHLGDPMTPALIRDPADAAATFVLMPFRI